MTHSFNEMKTLQTNVKLQLRHEIWLFSGEKPLFESTHLYECVDVVHESLSPANNELIHTRYGMRPTERVGIISMLFLIIKHGRCISERCVCVWFFTWSWGCSVWRTAGIWGSWSWGVDSERHCPAVQTSPHRSSAAHRKNPVHTHTYIKANEKNNSFLLEIPLHYGF